MKIFRWLFAAALAAAVAALDWYLDKPLHLQYGAWRESFSALRVLMALVICIVALQLFLKLCAVVLFFPSHLARWRRGRGEKSKYEAMAEGVRALATDDHKQAFKSFSRLAADDAKGVYAWLAARAAGALGDSEKRGEWLRRAAANSAEDIAAAAKAQLAQEENRLGEAFDILSTAGAPYGSPLLANIYLDIARKRRRWPQALAAAYRLQTQAGAQTKPADEIARAGLAEIGELEALKDFWKTNVAAEDRKKPALLAAYVYALHRLGGKEAEETLERALKSAAGAPEIIAAAADLGGQAMREDAFARGEKNADNKNAEYLSAMGALAGRLGLWGRARRYYQMANALHPEPRHAKELSELEEQMRAEAEDKSGFVRP